MQTHRLLLTLVSGLLPIQQLKADCINLDINKGTSPTYSGSAVAPDSGTFWNPLVSPAASTITLTDVKNSANVSTSTDITITRTSGGNFSVWDNATAANGNPNPVDLMREYLFSGPYQVTISELAPGSYTLYAFAHGDQASQNSTVTLAAATGGASGATGNSGTEWRNLFTTGAEGYSYLKLSGSVAAAGTFVFTTNYLNGFQIMPTPPPVIDVHPPASLTAYRGNDVSIGVTASSTAPASYQWQKSTDGGTNFAGIDTSGNPSAATATLEFDGVQFSDAGIYRVIVSSIAGSVTSGTCTLTVEENPAPLFSVHPASQVVLTGEQVVFTAAASAPTGVSYQWLKDDEIIPGETGASYTIASAELTNSGYYTVEASNTFGSATSEPAVLEVFETLPIPAFPGAEGPGSTASGGRGGEVYHVTTLDDDRVNPQPGSLRYGLTQNVPASGRTIVFDVGGTIRLLSSQVNDASSNIWLRSGANNITIAGQTAPYPGITIINQGTKITGTNVILRNLAFRPGPDPKSPGVSTNDGLSLQTKNSIIDHVSVGFSDDEGLSPTDAAANTTVQYCIIAEGLNYELSDGSRHAFGSLLASETADAPLSMHHNLFSDMSTRNPRIGNDGNGVTLGGPNEGSINNISNNLIYNWRGRASYDVGGKPARANFLANYFLAGPTTLTSDVVFFGSGTNTRIHHSGNMADMNKNGSQDPAPFQFAGAQMQGSVAIMASPFAVESGHLQTAAQARESVLNHAGSFWWNRPPLEARIIAEVRGEDGAQINHAANLPATTGYEYPATSGGPTYTEPTTGAILPIFDGLPLFPLVSRPAGFDTDQDGMPDEWESEHGLNPSIADNNGDFDSDGYTNLEEYLNDLAAFPAPIALTFSGAGGRYEHWKNWDLYWQPSRYDQVLIDLGNATLDSPGQHAGTLIIRGITQTPELHISDGWLKVAETCNIGGAGGSGRLKLTGGKLIVANGLGIADGGQLEAAGSGLVEGNLTNEAGGVIQVTGGTLAVSGDLANHGTLRIVNGATLQVGGAFTNHGLLDLMTGSQSLPAGFVNLGTVLDSTHIRVSAIEKSATSFSVTIQGYSGHSYQLMRAESLEGPWTPVGSPAAGGNAPLVFTDANATGTRCFYRVAVSP